MLAGGVLLGLKTATLAARGLVSIRSQFASQLRSRAPEAPLRVLYLAKIPSHATGTKYRILKWARLLESEGHEVRVDLTMPDSHVDRLFADWGTRARAEYHLRMLRGRMKSVSSAAGFDVAVIHMTDLPFWEYDGPFIARALKRRVGRLLLDLDDLPIVRGEQTAGHHARELASVADGLIVGNPLIAEHLPRRPTWYVPTCVDPAEWPVVDRSQKPGPPLLGWVGTEGNLRHLESIREPLAEVCRRHGTRVRVVCSKPPELTGVPVEFVKWSAEREVEDLLPIDIGLAPLLDGLPQRCKCGLKALQHMAAGAPVVASPVGALTSIVRHGETGMLAGTTPEWAESLDRLLSDTTRRLAMGTASREGIVRHWSFEAHRRNYVDAIAGTRSS